MQDEPTSPGADAPKAGTRSSRRRSASSCTSCPCAESVLPSARSVLVPDTPGPFPAGEAWTARCRASCKSLDMCRLLRGRKRTCRRTGLANLLPIEDVEEHETGSPVPERRRSWERQSRPSSRSARCAGRPSSPSSAAGAPSRRTPAPSPSARSWDEATLCATTAAFSRVSPPTSRSTDPAPSAPEVVGRRFRLDDRSLTGANSVERRAVVITSGARLQGEPAPRPVSWRESACRTNPLRRGPTPPRPSRP